MVNTQGYRENYNILLIWKTREIDSSRYRGFLE